LQEKLKENLGHDFTPEEMQKVIFGKNPEMTDEELEAAAEIAGVYITSSEKGERIKGGRIIFRWNLQRSSMSVSRATRCFRKT
jgi:hypothetical protein